MNEERQLVVHYINGETLKVAFPIQIKSSVGALMEVIKRALESEKLIIATESNVIIIPWSSIRNIELSPAVDGLPLGAIQKARIVA